MRPDIKERLKNIAEKQEAKKVQRAEMVVELEKVKADAAKANSVVALRAEVERLAEIIESLF